VVAEGCGEGPEEDRTRGAGLATACPLSVVTNVQVPPSGSSACRAHELRTYFGEDLVVD
jgi:hypothetical protein